MKKPTRVNHPPEVELPPGNRALVPPIYQSVKFEFEDLAATEQFLHGERPGFYYTRSGNPTNLLITGVLADPVGAGPSPFQKVGTGRVIFTARNTYTGTTEVVAGMLNIQDSQSLGLVGKILVVLARDDETARRSFRNLMNVKTIDAGELNTYDVLDSDWVVFTDATLPTAKESA